MLLVSVESTGAFWGDVVLLVKPDKRLGAIRLVVGIAEDWNASNTGGSHDCNSKKIQDDNGTVPERISCWFDVRFAKIKKKEDEERMWTTRTTGGM